MTCLIWGSMNGHFEVVRILLNTKADFNAQDKVMGGPGALDRVHHGGFRPGDKVMGGATQGH